MDHLVPIIRVQNRSKANIVTGLQGMQQQKEIPPAYRMGRSTLQAFDPRKIVDRNARIQIKVSTNLQKVSLKAFDYSLDPDLKGFRV